MWQKLSSLRRLFFGSNARAFGSVSLLLLGSLAVAPAKDYFSQWRRYQSGYLRLIRSRGDALTLERHFRPGLHQVWLPDLGVVDRCATCHVGLEEPSLADVTSEPFRKHPTIPHSLTQFGCVICHGGQGVATTVQGAHNGTSQWEQPILPARYLEAGCGQCHQNALTGTPQLNLGRKLLADWGCAHCHKIVRPDQTTVVSTEAPPLRRIAQKTSREWIYAWLKNPDAYSSTAKMANFDLSDADARDISAFLVAQSTTPPPPVPHASPEKKAPTEPASPQAGASLYGQSFCASCHATQNAAGMLVGGDFGPQLTRIGSKVRPEWLAAWLGDPGAFDASTRMPHYRFADAEISLLTGYLENKSDSDLLAGVHLDAASLQQVEHGKLLVTEYGCASCHDINGIRAPENFAPELSRIGSKSLSQIAFAEGVSHTLPDYITAKIRNPRAFGPGLKMPRFRFTDQEIGAVTTALLSLTDRSQTQLGSLRVPSRPQTGYAPAGRAGRLMQDLRCFSCHAINGRGGDMAPDLTWEGSVVQRQWLEEFLRNPNTLRPTLIRRMPKLGLTAQEVAILTDYIMTVYQTPAFDQDDPALSGLSADIAERGKPLFYSKYACQSCHIVDYQKDKGYIGPSLAQVGARLSPAWIYHWLKDPQSLVPGTIEPNRHMGDEDARALTAFLVSLKSPAGKGGGTK